MLRSRIAALGTYLPEHVMDNHELSQKVDTNDEWIVSRTGIRQRHIAAEGEYTSDLAAKAAMQAMERGNIDPASIDQIIVATETPDLTMPATALIVQQKLGMTHACAAYDLHAACSGFVYGWWNADAAIRAGVAKRILVIGAETFSRAVDWNDRSTCILFGDGAGAAVIEGVESDEQTGPGLLSCHIMADGNLCKLIETTGGVSVNQTTGILLMNGREVFRHAVGKMCDALDVALESAGLQLDDIDLLVPHQANARILSAIGQRLGLPDEKVIFTVDQHANTSAASIPLALNHALESGKLDEGKIVAMQALGAGLTWGACLIRW